ncbi:SymE family type I addiction module toxin [Xanthomonas sp. NCPPB 3005]|uniref:SymE family type I addiction module toxin n=2 Tax=Xanthomonas TaxID=338 RepID=UPI003512B885
MRQPSPRPTTPRTPPARKRAARQPKPGPAPEPVGFLRYIEPPCTPMMSVEDAAAAIAAELARPPRAPRRPRPPQTCTVGCGHSASGKRTPALRLGGRWMEALGFTIGSTLRVQVRDGELVVSVASKD